MDQHALSSAARHSQVTIRFEPDAAAPALRRLAELEGAGLPAGPLLVAEAGEEILAAVSLSDGEAIADPFQPTAGAVELLRLRARQLGREQRPPLWRRLLPRAAGRHQATLACSPPGVGGRLLRL